MKLLDKLDVRQGSASKHIEPYNMDEVTLLVEELRRPQLRLFPDCMELTVGMVWQQELFEALDDCRKVVAVYSPPYLASKSCREEFNIALFRDRDSEGSVVLPVYLYSADLPTYMKLIQFIDCREADRDELGQACEQILASCRLARGARPRRADCPGGREEGNALASPSGMSGN